MTFHCLTPNEAEPSLGQTVKGHQIMILFTVFPKSRQYHGLSVLTNVWDCFFLFCFFFLIKIILLFIKYIFSTFFIFIFFLYFYGKVVTPGLMQCWT